MKVALVILNWNGKHLLEKFLPLVIEHSADDAQIYVADNASTDDSVAYLKQHFPQIKCIQNTSNGGYAKGYNESLQGLTEELFILMNSDILTSQNWLKPIIKEFITDKNLGAAQPKILDLKRKSHFEYAGAAGGFIDRLGYPFCRGRIFETLEEDHGQYDDIAPIFWASGACLIIRNDLFWKVGALDELFFAHQEEIDLCWRIHGTGKTIKCIGKSTVYHLGGATLEQMNPQKTFLNFRNNLILLLKNVAGIQVWLLLFIRLCLDGIAAIKFLIDGKPAHFFAILRAHFNFYSKIFIVLKNRRNILKINNYYQINSIVWMYFVSKKKQYDETF